MNWIKSRGWLPLCLVFAALCCGAALMLFSRLVEQNVIRDAERSSLAWTQYAAGRLDRIDALADGAAPTPDDLEVIEALAEFGHAFRFNLFSADGQLQLVSDDAAGAAPDLGAHNPAAAAVVETGQPFTEVADGREKPDRPDLYTETYVPVVKDGEIAAIVELYLDQTETQAAIRDSYAAFGIAILVCCLVGFGGPSLGLLHVLRRLRRNNAHLAVERRRAEAADQAKTEFLANVTHELRTPMNGVLGLAELMEAQPLDEDGREALGLLRSSAAEQLALINQLLDVTKIENGDLKLDRAPFDPAGTLRSAVALIAPQAASKGIALDLGDAAAGGPLLLGDAGAFRQICTNLVSNAVKFTEEGHVRIGLAVEPRGDAASVSLAVADDGPGIPREDQARIFKRFVQLDGSLSRAAEGTGLGLAITKALVDLMGGVIRLDSAPGQGATFRVAFDLPLSEVPELKAAA